MHQGDPENLNGVLEDYSGPKKGTIIRFKPDATIFDDVEFTSEVIDHRLRELAFLNRGVKIIFTDNREEEPVSNEYQFEGGIQSYVDVMNENKTPLFQPSVYLKNKRDDYEVEIALQYLTDYYDENVKYYFSEVHYLKVSILRI